MQFMWPAQLEAAGRKFPAVYVPFGPIEWHGVHLPLGNDAIKAHGILVECAEKFGGVVYPPVYFHNGFEQTGKQAAIWGRDISILIDVGEVMGDGKDLGVPIHTYRNFRRQEGLTVVYRSRQLGRNGFYRGWRRGRS